MEHPDQVVPQSRRLRRWLIGLGVCAALLAVYAFSLNWFAQRLGDDMEKTIRPPTAAADNDTLGGYY
ncbi:MAG: hypothetical protein M3Q13_07520 [Pseudomonadota bacterium]|nr:hypothetical protein [Pseudomonadota bacterium]